MRTGFLIKAGFALALLSGISLLADNADAQRGGGGRGGGGAAARGGGFGGGGIKSFGCIGPVLRH
jgi:hypothetical protein